jgi:hypothetical protein
MVYLDRFVIGALVSLSAAVAFDTTPFEVVTKLWIVPIALETTLFPAFAAASTQNTAKPAELFARGIGLMHARHEITVCSSIRQAVVSEPLIAAPCYDHRMTNPVTTMILLALLTLAMMTGAHVLRLVRQAHRQRDD